jgi:hypothetical protein
MVSASTGNVRTRGVRNRSTTVEAEPRSDTADEAALPSVIGVSTGLLDAWRQAVEWWWSAETVQAGSLKAVDSSLEAARSGVASAHDWQEAMETAARAGHDALEQWRARQFDLAFSAYMLGAGIASSFLAALADDSRRQAATEPAAGAKASKPPVAPAEMWMYPWLPMMMSLPPAMP